ncbi:MAG TPA: DUF951 domain-containing protein [Limnochordia bacterium]|nr:DUF951 domain-containing protein [Limnochordia bacterium]
MPGKFFLGDVVQLRKVHPCGSDQWEVMRVGMDFRIRCLGCKRVLLLPRVKFERAVRRVVASPAAQASGEETPPNA